MIGTLKLTPCKRESFLCEGCSKANTLQKRKFSMILALKGSHTNLANSYLYDWGLKANTQTLQKRKLLCGVCFKANTKILQNRKVPMWWAIQALHTNLSKENIGRLMLIHKHSEREHSLFVLCFKGNTHALRKRKFSLWYLHMLPNAGRFKLYV